MFERNLQATLLTFGLIAGANAQKDGEVSEMITDRPDQTESPNAVPKGYFQVETGSSYQAFEDNSTKTELVTYNTSLLRYGIIENLELRLGFNIEDAKVTTNNSQALNGETTLSPLLAGMKIYIAEEKGFWPEMGLVGHLYLPFTVNRELRPEITGVDFRFSFAHTLSAKSSLAYNVGAQWLDDSPEAAYVYTFVYGYSVSEKFGLYAELYGDLPENSSANHLWDAGFTYALQSNIQLDATVGRSITKGQDILLSAGISFRIPN